jgi:cytochrome P450
MSPLRQTLSWSLRPFAFQQRCRREFGDAFSVTFLGFQRPMVLLSDPVAIKALYREPGHALPPGRNLFLEPIVGSRSLLLLEGADHLAHRKLMLPAFHGERMRGFEPMVAAIAGADVDSWPLGEELALHPHMQAVTLEVILRIVFGVSEGPRLDRLRLLLRNLLSETGNSSTQLRALLMRRFGRSANVWARFEDRLREVDELLFAEIAEHRSRPDLAESDDILAMLMTAEFEGGAPSAERPSEIAGDDEREGAKRESGRGMDDVELRDQLMTLLLAGHETTATALAWTFDLLLRHEAAMTRLRETLEAGDESYLRAVITESLRLRPVVPIAGRRLKSDLVADDLHLPAGTDVTPAIWLAHTREQAYPEPFAFRPERFLEGGPDTYSWIPFGGSVRRCIGGAFAEFEMGIVIREILARTELRKADPAPEKVARRNITLSPRNGTPVVLTARRAAREREPLAAF